MNEKLQKVFKTFLTSYLQEKEEMMAKMERQA